MALLSWGCVNPLRAGDSAAVYEAMQLHVDAAVVKAVMAPGGRGCRRCQVDFLLARAFPATEMTKDHFFCGAD